jgi:hypothetical protein
MDEELDKGILREWFYGTFADACKQLDRASYRMRQVRIQDNLYLAPTEGDEAAFNMSLAKILTLVELCASSNLNIMDTESIAEYSKEYSSSLRNSMEDFLKQCRESYIEDGDDDDDGGDA